MKTSNSSVQLRVSTVKKLCDEKLESINIVRAGFDKDIEDEYLGRWNKRPNWLMRLFGAKQKNYTKEDFKKHVAENPMKSCFWRYPSSYGWGNVEIIEKLLHAVEKVSPDAMMTITAEDLQWL